MPLTVVRSSKLTSFCLFLIRSLVRTRTEQPLGCLTQDSGADIRAKKAREMLSAAQEEGAGASSDAGELLRWVAHGAPALIQFTKFCLLPKLGCRTEEAAILGI